MNHSFDGAHSFDGKVVLITGGASGIGCETALAFARRGAQVVTADIAFHATPAADPALDLQVVDVTSEEQMSGLESHLRSRYARLDCAVNAAAIGGGGIRLHQYPADAYEKIMDVNVAGVFRAMKCELALMLKTGAGAIVNVSSVAGLTGNVRNAPYSASKHAVIGLTRSAALEYAARGIRINAVCPGFTRTPATEQALTPEDIRDFERLIPMNRMAEPAEIAAMILFLCSDAASYVTGQAICVDGGLRS